MPLELNFGEIELNFGEIFKKEVITKWSGSNLIDQAFRSVGGKFVLSGLQDPLHVT